MITSLFRARGLSTIVGLAALGLTVGIVRYKLSAVDLRHGRTYVFLGLLGAFAYTCGFVVTNLIIMSRQNRHR